jgi:hypothetical protein
MTRKFSGMAHAKIATDIAALHFVGGNQRELARAKAAKKAGASGKGKPKVCRLSVHIGEERD